MGRRHYLIPSTPPTDNHAQQLWRDSLQEIREERVAAGESLPRYEEEWRDLPESQQAEYLKGEGETK